MNPQCHITNLKSKIGEYNINATLRDDSIALNGHRFPDFKELCEFIGSLPTDSERGLWAEILCIIHKSKTCPDNLLYMVIDYLEGSKPLTDYLCGLLAKDKKQPISEAYEACRVAWEHQTYRFGRLPTSLRLSDQHRAVIRGLNNDLTTFSGVRRTQGGGSLSNRGPYCLIDTDIPLNTDFTHLHDTDEMYEASRVHPSRANDRMLCQRPCYGQGLMIFKFVTRRQLQIEHAYALRQLPARTLISWNRPYDEQFK